MKVFQPRHIHQQEKNAETPLPPTDKTPKSLLNPPFGGFGGVGIGVNAKITLAKPEVGEPLDELPKPSVPSSIWLEAIAKARELDPSFRYLLRLAWPDDATRELSRLSQPSKLVEALEALSKRFPLADGVMVCPLGRLIPIFVTGNPEAFTLHPEVEP